MASGCIIPNLDTARYSSPVPVIGLYIAAGSLVCLLLMLFDILSAYRREQSWIPCRLFKLNSFTLTLLSIASKLQVDLTTPMPGVPDQLSKLTGTTLLCICMGFSNPSVGNNKGSEYLSNMAALSIMIITVVVNICIQFYTGVIYLFIPEHIIILCCTFMVLFLMWVCAHTAKVRNLEDIKCVTSPMIGGKSGDLLKRLKSCYAHGFDKNRQLRACRSDINITLLFFCLVCFCVLVQATVRSVALKQLRLCGGGSDYDWSTWFILITQYLTIIVGCLAICFRWFASFPAMQSDLEKHKFVGDDVSMKRKFISILGSRSLNKSGIYLLTCSWYMVKYLKMLVLLPQVYLFRFVGGTLYKDDNKERHISVQEFILQNPKHSDYRYPCSRTMEKAVNDIDKCVKESKKDSPEELFKLFSRISPSPQFRYRHEQSKVVSPLSIVVLVRAALLCLPEDLTQTLAQCFHEVVDILQIGIDPKDEVYHIFMKNPLLVETSIDYPLRRAVLKISKSYISPLCYADLILSELLFCSEPNYGVIKAINRRTCKTVEELYHCIELLFVDMLHSFFRELPNAIVKVVTECPIDEYKDRVRRTMVALLKITPLENRMELSFPENCGIRSLISLPQPLKDADPYEVEEGRQTEDMTFGESWGAVAHLPTPPPGSTTEEDHVQANISSHLREDNTAEVDDSSGCSHHHVTMEIEEL